MTLPPYCLSFLSPLLHGRLTSAQTIIPARLLNSQARPEIVAHEHLFLFHFDLLRTCKEYSAQLHVKLVVCSCVYFPRDIDDVAVGYEAANS